MDLPGGDWVIAGDGGNPADRLPGSAIADCTGRFNGGVSLT